VEFAAKHKGVYAAVGIYPHEKGSVEDLEPLLVASEQSLSSNTPLGVGADLLQEDCSEVATINKVIALGDIGLDYYRPHNKKQQIKLFEQQLDLAQKYNLPVSFHVRDAFDDFFAVLSHFRGIRGVVHSFSDNSANLDKALACGLCIGLNGIITFRLSSTQAKAISKVPLEKMLLETDAPYLTPAKKRGKTNQPSYVKLVAEWVAEQRGLSLQKVAKTTTKNASDLFGI
jgi:TatD DNase family protein